MKKWPSPIYHLHPAMQIAVPGRLNAAPIPGTVRVAVSVDEPDLDAGLIQGTDDVLEWVLGFQIAEKVDRHGTLTERNFNRMIEASVHIAAEINHGQISENLRRFQYRASSGAHAQPDRFGAIRARPVSR